MKVLITSGGTKIPIDSVRDITNMSTGTFGSKIAEECLNNNHSVHFIRAKDSKSPMRFTVDFNKQSSLQDLYDKIPERMDWKSRYTESEYKTFEQYERCLQFGITGENPDVVVLAAAVSDYHVAKPMNGKFRSNDMLNIKLESLPKLINKVKGIWSPNVKLVGFKLLVGSIRNELIAAARKSIVENGCDMVVANDLEHIKSNKHKVLLVFPNDKVLEYDSDPNDPNFLAKVVVKHVELL